MLQEIIVGIIGVAVFLIVIYKVYRFFLSADKQNGSCGCSDCSCNTAKKHVKY